MAESRRVVSGLNTVVSTKVFIALGQLLFLGQIDVGRTTTIRAMLKWYTTTAPKRILHASRQCRVALATIIDFDIAPATKSEAIMVEQMFEDQPLRVIVASFSPVKSDNPSLPGTLI